MMHWVQINSTMSIDLNSVTLNTSANRGFFVFEPSLFRSIGLGQFPAAGQETLAESKLARSQSIWSCDIDVRCKSVSVSSVKDFGGLRGTRRTTASGLFAILACRKAVATAPFEATFDMEPGTYEVAIQAWDTRNRRAMWQ